MSALPIPAPDVSDLSDAELLDHIAETGKQFLDAHSRYLASSCLADKGDRDRWYLAQRAALLERARRPQMVARMEQERGLA
jgi:16S rRNA G966 N2-methylase RsmD